MAKVQISIDDELLVRLDAYADNHYMTRSGVIAYAVNNILLQEEATQLFRNISLAMKKIADTGTITDEQKKDLDDFNKLASALTGGSF